MEWTDSFPAHGILDRMPLESMDAVEYTVRFSQPGTHYAEIEAILPAGGASAIDVFLPVWTPGSYMVREYSRHVEEKIGRAHV